MSYQALARKWRPKTFAELSGQEHVVRALSNALERGRLDPADAVVGAYWRLLEKRSAWMPK